MGRNLRRVQQPRTDFALDGRRLAGVAAAAAIVAAVVFVAGLEVGRGPPEAELAAPADRLALLDEAGRIAAETPGGEPVVYGFHGQLTAEKEPAPVIVAPKARPTPAVKRAPAAVQAPAVAPRPAAQAAPAAAAPAPARVALAAPAAPAVTPWSIQLGASTDAADAKRLAAKHDGAQVVSADVDGRRWYRVRLSGFASRADAQTALAKLERETGAHGFVTGR